MHRFLKISIFFLISCLIGSCSLLPNELKTAESLIESNPDSALHILQSYHPEQYTSSENRALYGLLMFQALGKKKLPMKPDSLIDFSIDYYTNHPDGDRLASCYLYKGRSYKYSFQYEQAMIFYLKALDELQDSENNILLGRVNFDLGDIYNIQGDFAAARQKYKNAYINFSKGNNQLLKFYSLVNIGRTHHDAKEFRTADELYKKYCHWQLTLCNKVHCIRKLV